MKVNRWYRGAKKSIDPWQLWLCRCKARMEDKNEFKEAVWLLKIAKGMNIEATATENMILD